MEQVSAAAAEVQPKDFETIKILLESKGIIFPEGNEFKKMVSHIENTLAKNSWNLYFTSYNNISEFLTLYHQNNAKKHSKIRPNSNAIEVAIDAAEYLEEQGIQSFTKHEFILFILTQIIKIHCAVIYAKDLYAPDEKPPFVSVTVISTTSWKHICTRNQCVERTYKLRIQEKKIR